MRMREAQTHPDPTDPDPLHCMCTFVDVLNAVLHIHNPALDLLLEAGVVLHNIILVLESLLFQGLSLLLHDTKLPSLLY
jgi:hypothetical protein